jgi:hypothetical protein
MNTVFISGSRNMGRLNAKIRERLENITQQNFHVVVGDANGADKAVQGFLADAEYKQVTVYCAGSRCRNNMGAWSTVNVDVDPRLKGRDFYTQKDLRMAADADYGFVLWDGKSPGSINNVIELLQRGKQALVYLSPKQQFATVSDPESLRTLLALCDAKDIESMDKKIGLNRSLQRLEGGQQAALGI